MSKAEMKNPSNHLIESAFLLAEERSIPCVLANTFLKENVDLINSLRSKQKILWLESERLPAQPKARVDLVVPSVSYELNSVSRVKIGIFLGYIQGFLEYSDSVACLTTQSRKGEVDTLLIASPKKFFPWLGKRAEIFQSFLRKISPLTFICLLEVSLRLVKEGKEGKHIGALLVLGDPEALEPFTRQLILNPLKGHPKKVRNIRNPAFFETIRELSSVDGGFVVSPQGVVLSAGTYFHSTTHKANLKKGLGARHAAAAFITKQVECIAIVISGSSSQMSIFYAGKPILEGE